MKISIKQLKQIIKEEVGRGPQSFGASGDDDFGSVLARAENEITALAQVLAEAIVDRQNPGLQEPTRVGEVDGLYVEIENALREAVEDVIAQFE